MSELFLMNTYARMPVAFEHGRGAWLFDEHGHRYLDAISGIGVCNLGHADPVIAQVIAEQARTLIHTANLGHIPAQQRLAETLCRISQMDKAFITNTGAEAVECAIKIARHYGFDRGIEQPSIVCMSDAFHGRTIAAITASAPGKLQQGFDPLPGGFERVPFNDVDALEQHLSTHPACVAVLLEPIQGEGGVQIPDPGYWTALRQLCDERHVLLMFDEIQCGLYRTGRAWAHQHEPQALPDVLTTAKALGNGLPVAACLARGPAATTLQPGSHGSTFGGSPLACSTALAVLERMRFLRLDERAAAIGLHMLDRLNQQLKQHPRVSDVRGQGLMIGIELIDDASDVRAHALAHGVLINVTRDCIIRLLPPLIIDRSQANRIVDTVVEGINHRGAELAE
ncbi:MAG: aspartate aminotransferase family protein [Pseudomonadota bacterium]